MCPSSILILPACCFQREENVPSLGRNKPQVILVQFHQGVACSSPCFGGWSVCFGLLGMGSQICFLLQLGCCVCLACMFPCLLAYLFVRLAVCLHTYLPACLFVSLSVCIWFFLSFLLIVCAFFFLIGCLQVRRLDGFRFACLCVC